MLGFHAKKKEKNQPPDQGGANANKLSRALDQWEYIRQYNPSNQTELHTPRNQVTLQQPWMYLVHMARFLGGGNSRRDEVLQQNFESQIQTWDIISTSLVTNQAYSAVIGEVGYILDVPSQNILSANMSDVWFRNHIGRAGEKPQGEIKDPYALVDHIQYRSRRMTKMEQLKYLLRGGLGIHENLSIKLYEDIHDPQALAKQCAISGSYNEVLVIGRQHIRMYEDRPATGPIKVKGIYMSMNANNPKYDQYVNLARKMSAVNNNVPVLFVSGRYSLKWLAKNLEDL